MSATVLKPSPSRLSGTDSVRAAASGLLSRPTRALLSGLGIAVGIAAMVAVVGISASSREQVNEQLRDLGTNMLTAEAGQSITGGAAMLPVDSVDMVQRIDAVDTATAVGAVDANVYRNKRVDPNRTNGITVLAANPDLLTTVSGAVVQGRWLDDALAAYPTVVLGSAAAERLGITRTDGSVSVWLGGEAFVVVGILDDVTLAPELDAAALIGWSAAEQLDGAEVAPSRLYVRADESHVEDVQSVLGRTINPASPGDVAVSRPSDALKAQAETDATLTTLLLALAGVALVVGGIGVANTMVIAVLERRSEIGLRRALGATRAHVRRQFLGESIMLAAIGGVGGAVLGAAFTVAFAVARGWPPALPLWAVMSSAACTIVVGALAGAYPATRAARLQPTVALATA